MNIEQLCKQIATDICGEYVAYVKENNGYNEIMPKLDQENSWSDTPNSWIQWIQLGEENMSIRVVKTPRMKKAKVTYQVGGFKITTSKTKAYKQFFEKRCYSYHCY